MAAKKPKQVLVERKRAVEAILDEAEVTKGGITNPDAWRKFRPIMWDYLTHWRLYKSTTTRCDVRRIYEGRGLNGYFAGEAAKILKPPRKEKTQRRNGRRDKKPRHPSPNQQPRLGF